MLRAIFLLVFCSFSAGAFADMNSAVQLLQTEWAKIKYQMPKDKQEAELEKLSVKAGEISAEFPDKAEPLVWEAIIRSTYAGAKGGLGALGLVEQARDLLLKAEKIEPNALNGSIYTSLGSLYYQVPGWPIGFGDNDKAREYLQKALSINPDGIDPNYFYGDFLIEEGEYKQAIAALEKALQAPPRADRPVADVGRKKEIEAALAKARKELE